VPENDPLWVVVGVQVALLQSQTKAPLELDALSKQVDALKTEMHAALRQHREVMDRQIADLRQQTARNAAAGSQFQQHADQLHFFERWLYVAAGGTIFILGLLVSGPLSDLCWSTWNALKHFFHT
jgi:hypothetical protein